MVGIDTSNIRVLAQLDSWFTHRIDTHYYDETAFFVQEQLARAKPERKPSKQARQIFRDLCDGYARDILRTAEPFQNEYRSCEEQIATMEMSIKTIPPQLVFQLVKGYRNLESAIMPTRAFVFRAQTIANLVQGQSLIADAKAGEIDWDYEGYQQKISKSIGMPADQVGFAIKTDETGNIVPECFDVICRMTHSSLDNMMKADAAITSAQLQISKTWQNILGYTYKGRTAPLQPELEMMHVYGHAIQQARNRIHQTIFGPLFEKQF